MSLKLRFPVRIPAFLAAVAAVLMFSATGCGQWFDSGTSMADEFLLDDFEKMLMINYGGGTYYNSSNAIVQWSSAANHTSEPGSEPGCCLIWLGPKWSGYVTTKWNAIQSGTTAYDFVTLQARSADPSPPSPLPSLQIYVRDSGTVFWPTDTQEVTTSWKSFSSNMKESDAKDFLTIGFYNTGSTAASYYVDDIWLYKQ